LEKVSSVVEAGLKLEGGIEPPHTEAEDCRFVAIGVKEQDCGIAALLVMERGYGIEALLVREKGY
jgi:hypothetical protein